MTVRLSGLGHDDRPISLNWELVAQRNHGPEIPAMAAVLLALRVAREPTPQVGAEVCMGLLDLADFEAEFSRWNITTSVTRSGPEAVKGRGF